VKNFIITLFLITLGHTSCLSQFSKNSFSAEGYLGVPNLSNVLLFNNIEKRFNNVENYGVNGSIWSYGGRINYFIAERFSVGLDINHDVSGCYFEYQKYDSLTQLNIDFKADYTSKKTRFLFRVDIQIINQERLNVYAGLGIGYKHVKRTIIATEPQFDEKRFNFSGAFFPVGARIAIGTRYYFVPNAGIFGEIGIMGGALVQGGITLRM
jgi:opacity protein-like surface antigen